MIARPGLCTIFLSVAILLFDRVPLLNSLRCNTRLPQMQSTDDKADYAVVHELEAVAAALCSARVDTCSVPSALCDFGGAAVLAPPVSRGWVPFVFCTSRKCGTRTVKAKQQASITVPTLSLQEQVLQLARLQQNQWAAGDIRETGVSLLLL